MDDVGSFMHYNFSTALLCEILEPILCVHVLFAKIAVLILESRVIDREQLAKDLAFHLLYEICEGVAIDEATLLGIMGMQIKVEGESVL